MSPKTLKTHIIFIFYIFQLLFLIIKSSSCSYNTCYDCVVCGDDEASTCSCEWNENAATCRTSSKTQTINVNSFWTYFESCTDRNSLALRNKHCGEYEVSLDENNKAKISFQNVNEKYAFTNLYCDYSFTSTDDKSSTDYYQLKATITSKYSASLIIHITIIYNDDTRTIGTLDSNIDKELLEVKQIIIRIYSYKSFDESPFSIEINKKAEKKSYGLYFAVGTIIVSCILCGLLIYCFSKRISESARIRQRALLEMAMQRQQNQAMENGTDRNFERESENSEDIMEQNFKKIEILLKTSLAAKKYHKNMGLKDGTNCTICIEKFRNNKSKVSVTSCGHVFHYKCLSSWLTKNVVNPKCPNCNHNFLLDIKNEDLVNNNNNNNINVQESNEVVNINTVTTTNNNNNDQNGNLPENMAPNRNVINNVENGNIRINRNRNRNRNRSHNHTNNNNRNNGNEGNNNNNNNVVVQSVNNNDTDNIEEIVIVQNGGN